MSSYRNKRPAKLIVWSRPNIFWPIMPPEDPFPCLKMGKTKNVLTFCHILASSKKRAQGTGPDIRTTTCHYPQVIKNPHQRFGVVFSQNGIGMILLSTCCEKCILSSTFTFNSFSDLRALIEVYTFKHFFLNNVDQIESYA